MIQCKTCKKKISEKAKVCPNCGEKTLYGIKKQQNIIILLIILFVVISLFLIFGKTVIKTVKIVGVWKYTENFEKGSGFQCHSRYGSPGVIKGKKTITYTFDINGECTEKTNVTGTNFIDACCNTVGRCFNAYSEPYEKEEVRKCEYKLKENNKKIELFFYEEYNEKKEYCDNIDSEDPDDHCIEWNKKEYIDNHYFRLKNDNMYIDGNKYIKMD